MKLRKKLIQPFPSRRKNGNHKNSEGYGKNSDIEVPSRRKQKTSALTALGVSMATGISFSNDNPLAVKSSIL